MTIILVCTKVSRISSTTQTEPCLNMKQNKRKQKVQTWYDHIGISEACHMNELINDIDKLRTNLRNIQKEPNNSKLSSLIK